MKKGLLIGIPLIVLAALVGWRLQSNKQTAGALAQQSGQRRGGAAAVELAVAGPKTLVSTIEAVGSAESPFKIEISPKLTGRIEFLTLREGDPVRKGEVLVRIDPSEQRALVLQQQANVAEARSRLAQAQLGQGANETGIETTIEQRRAELLSAKADFNQMQRNYDAVVASADADVTDADAKVQSSKTKVDNAVAEVGRQEANLTNAKAKLDRAEALLKEGFTSVQAVEDARTTYELQRANVEVAKGQLASAKNDVQSASAQLKSAQNKAQIARRKGQADVESAKADVTKAEAALRGANANRSQNPAYRQNLAALQAGVQAAQAQLDQARSRLNDLALLSPIDGTVTQRSADPGSMASPGSPVLVVQSLDWLFVTGSLPLSDAPNVHDGQEAQVTFDALPDLRFRGVISQVNAAADPQSRQFGIRVRLDNGDHAIKPGMFGRISIVTSRVQAAVVVPLEAVKTSPDGKSTVIVIDKDSKAVVREVTTGAKDNEVVQILSGADPGESIVKLTYQPIKDGQSVKIAAPKDEGKGRGRGK